MSREIKFRVWGKKETSFIKNCVLKADGSIARPIMKNDYDISSLNPNDFVVNFYTGLKDCKGVEIYEGDIVEFALSLIKTIKGSIEFDWGAFYLKTDDKEYNNVLLVNMNFDLVEVIGNIHQNGDLLDGYNS